MTQNNHFARVAELDKVVVRHPALDRALFGIEDCVEKTLCYRESVGSLLLAEGGMGKTTICRALLARMPETIKRDSRLEKTVIPAFYAEVPSPATVKTVAASLLRKLNDPSPLAGTTAHMTDRLCRLLELCETRLVFLDEFHHLFDIQKTTARLNTEVCKWVKGLVNKTKVSFCLVGLPKFAPILWSDSQLARRFALKFPLSALRPGNREQPGLLQPFLAEVVQQAMQRLQLTAMPRLSELQVATQMYAATSGNPAFVMALIKESTLVALQAGADQVTLDHFALAWDRGTTVYASLTKNNPFRMSAAALAGSLRERL